MYLSHLYIVFHFILFILTFIVTSVELAFISLAILQANCKQIALLLLLSYRLSYACFVQQIFRLHQFRVS